MTTPGDKRSALVRDRKLLFVMQGPEFGTVFSVPAGGALIGRKDGATLVLTGNTICPEHARLVVEGADVFLESETALAQTFVNETPLEGRVRLADGDYLRFGGATVAKFSVVTSLEEHALRTLSELTLRDPLTRLYNRRYFNERLKGEFAFAHRQSVPLALLLIDIDHFKRVNDTWGHQAGDVVLRLIAQAISHAVRHEDVVARYGGEEFMVIARNTSRDHALILAERLRDSVARAPMTVSQHQLQVTVSVGVAELGCEAAASPEALISRADEALYQAKNAGRNRVGEPPRATPED